MKLDRAVCITRATRSPLIEQLSSPLPNPLPQVGEGAFTPLSHLWERGWGRGCKPPPQKTAGFTLLPVVLAMSLIAAIAFLLNRDNGINVNMVSKQMDTDRAYYAAEAGLQAANARIQSLGCTGSFPTSASPVTNNAFGTASYSAYSNFSALPSTNSNTNTVNLVSTGTFKGTSVTLTRNNVVVYNLAPDASNTANNYNTFTLQPDATVNPHNGDTYIKTNDPDNKGGETLLEADYTKKYPLFKFDLSMFPAGSLPTTATLSLYIDSGSWLGVLDLYRLSSNWQESTVNWTTRIGATTWTTPGGDFHPTRASRGDAISGAGKWINFDVTDLTVAWLQGRYQNDGVLLDTVAIGTPKIMSRENADVVHRPKITFEYLVPCGAINPPSDAQTLPLSATMDSFNDSASVQANNGGATTLKLFNTPTQENRILTQFDVSSIPSGKTILSAKLRMYVSGVTNATALTKSLWANAVSESWEEGVDNNVNKSCPIMPAAGTTWDYRTYCVNWSLIHPPKTIDSWATMANMPTKRTGQVVAMVNNKIYAIGGQTTLGASTVTGAVEEYNPATNTWATKAAMINRRSRAAVAVVNGKIYVIGGTLNNLLGSVSNINEVYDPATNTWTAKASMSNPRKNLGVASVNGKIYAIGGQGLSGTILGVNEEYDPVTNTWVSKAVMPTARQWLSAQAVNGKIYAIGGIVGLFDSPINEEYDPATNMWATKAPMTGFAALGLDSMSSAVWNNKVYLFGGYQAGFGSVVNWSRAYDPVSNTYQNLLNHPALTQLAAAATVGNRIYSIGGDDAVAPLTVNNFRYDPGVPLPVATAVNESTAASPLEASFTSGWITFDLTSLVQNWVNTPSSNNGVVLYTDMTDQFSINSRENSANKPELIVTY